MRPLENQIFHLMGQVGLPRSKRRFKIRDAFTLSSAILHSAIHPAYAYDTRLRDPLEKHYDE